MTLNRNSLPFDPNGPWFTSGLRIGTPGVTTLGMGVTEMKEIAAIVKLILTNTTAADDVKQPGTKSKAKYILDQKAKSEARLRVTELLPRYPLYPELDLGFLEKHFGE